MKPKRKGGGKPRDSKLGQLREQHTAARRCTVLLRALERHYPSVATESNGDSFGALFTPMWEGTLGPVDGDALLAALLGPTDSEDALALPPNAEERARWVALVAATAYCVQAIRADEAGDHRAAWDFAFDAGQWEGFLSGRLDASTASMREIASRGGRAAQAESNAFAAEVRAWCEERLAQYGSLNKLADDAFAAKLNPAARATVRKWLTTWAEEWRADGRWRR